MKIRTWLWTMGLTLGVAGCANGPFADTELDLEQREEALLFLGLSTQATLPLPVSYTGSISLVFGRTQAGAAAATRAFLRTDEGEVLEVGFLTEAMAKRSTQPLVEGSLVTVSGYRSKGRLAAVSADPEASALAAPALTGAQPWVSVLCRFADLPDQTPETPAFFSNLMSNSYPGMDHFFREVSYGNINLAGSSVRGWYNLPFPRSHYITELPDGSLQSDLAALAQDCFAAGNADIDYAQVRGVNLMFNQLLDDYAWGGSAFMPFDGVNASIRTTWMPPWGYRNHDVLGQEMGHGFGLPHSSGPYQATYDSNWDVMSGGGACRQRHPSYGCIAVHTIAPYKDRLGWLPAARKQTVSTLGTTSLSLSRLAQPSGDGLLMVKIPISQDGNRFYTVEARNNAGYDAEIPGEGVLIHLVDLTRPDRVAQVVDGDGNGSPNDAGSIWISGETFNDPTNGVTVEVLARSDALYWIRVTNAGKRLSVSRAMTGGATGRVTSTPTGIDCGTDCSEYYTVGRRVQLTATSGLRSHFAGFQGCDSAVGTTCVVTMDRARSVTANFEPEVPGCYEDCLEACYDEGQLLPRQCVQMCRTECR